MRKEEFERRAAEMRMRLKAAPAKANTSNQRTPVEQAKSVLRVPDLQTAAPYSSLHNVWKSSHTKSLLAALGNADPLILRTAKTIGTQSVAFDGLVHLRGNGVLNVAASVLMLPEALRSYSLLIEAVVRVGGTLTATDETTITLGEEHITIRLRETSERRTRPAEAPGWRDHEYVPSGHMWFSAVLDQGSNMKTPAQDVHGFLNKINRLVNRLPRLREERCERLRLHDEEWNRKQAEWKREEDARRQWKEQQDRFNEVTGDSEQWAKAERIRAYAAAFEIHQSAANGPISVGSPVDGWLRWLHWYAEHLDPITRPGGPKQGPEDQ